MANENVSVDVVQALARAIRLGAPKLRRPGRPAARRRNRGEQQLLSAANKGHQILLKANTVFPFNFFPDTITIDREKLTIANRFFFRVAKITSVPVRDILSVEADVGPFFGSVHLTSRYFFTNPQTITFLWRGDAIKIQRLLQGYIIAHERNIDCSAISKNHLLDLLYDLGRGDTD